MWWDEWGLCLMGVKFLRASGEIKFNFLTHLKIQSLSSRSLLSLCVVTLSKIGSASKTYLFYMCPNYSLSVLFISVAAESLNKISTFLLISDVKFMILKFSRFIMSWVFVVLLSFPHSFSSAPLQLPSPNTVCHCAWAAVQVSEEWVAVHHRSQFSNFLWKIQVIVTWLR